MYIVGVTRSSAYSPNSNDLDIMQRVASLLQNGGHRVELISEDLLKGEPCSAKLYFSMARSEKALEVLKDRKQKGCIVVNAPNGVERCARITVTRLMQQWGMDIPKSLVVQTEALPTMPASWKFPCWLKRGDACAQQRDDVSFISDEEELQRAITLFCQRGIATAVVCEHLEGDILKFYGVAQTGFFYWYYPTLVADLHSKFGLEAINGPACCYPFSAERLQQQVEAFAQYIEVPVYGGDAIVNAQGEWKLIDFNDWPSYSRCANDAASAIVKYLLSHVESEREGSGYI